MWSDPDEVENWAVSPRGAGWLFGGNVTREVTLPRLLGIAVPLANEFEVQPPEFAQAYCACTSTSTGRLQVYV